MFIYKYSKTKDNIYRWWVWALVNGIRARYRAMCERGGKTPKGGWILGGVPVRMSGLKGCRLGVPYRLEKRTNACENAGPRKGWIVRSHVQLERRTKHSLQVCGNLSLANHFKNLEQIIFVSSKFRLLHKISNVFTE